MLHKFSYLSSTSSTCILSRYITKPATVGKKPGKFKLGKLAMINEFSKIATLIISQISTLQYILEVGNTFWLKK